MHLSYQRNAPVNIRFFVSLFIAFVIFGKIVIFFAYFLSKLPFYSPFLSYISLCKVLHLVTLCPFFVCFSLLLSIMHKNQLVIFYNIPILLSAFIRRLKQNCGAQTKKHGSRNAPCRRSNTAGKCTEQALLRHRLSDTFRQCAAKSQQRHSRARTRPLLERLIHANRRQYHAKHHIGSQNARRCQSGFVNQNLAQRADSPSCYKRIEILQLGLTLSHVFQHGSMTNARNALSLLHTGRAHQCSGRRDNHAPQLSRRQFRQYMRAQHGCHTAAARTARMDILFFREQQNPAVLMLVRQHNAVVLRHRAKQPRTDASQITGINDIIIPRMRSRIAEQRANGVICRRCHGRTHIIGIGHPQITNFPKAGMRQAHGRLYVCMAYHAGARRRCRPLSGRRALSAIGERKTVLPFCRTEMRGCRRAHALGIAAINHTARQQQPFYHCGAGAVHTEIWHLCAARRIAGCNTLTEQIARNHQIQRRNRQTAFVRRQPHSSLLHMHFCLLPCRFSAQGIRKQLVELCAERPFLLLFSADSRPRGQHRRLFKGNRAHAHSFSYHDDLLTHRRILPAQCHTR